MLELAVLLAGSVVEGVVIARILEKAAPGMML
jgi:hypothetical protein